MSPASLSRDVTLLKLFHPMQKSTGSTTSLLVPTAAVVRPLDAPIKPTGGLAILRGNLAPEGCVVKLAGHERRRHTGPARVFECEEEAMAAASDRPPPTFLV